MKAENPSDSGSKLMDANQNKRILRHSVSKHARMETMETNVRRSIRLKECNHTKSCKESDIDLFYEKYVPLQGKAEKACAEHSIGSCSVAKVLVRDCLVNNGDGCSLPDCSNRNTQCSNVADNSVLTNRLLQQDIEESESDTDTNSFDSDSSSEDLKSKYMKERMEIDMRRKSILKELNIATLIRNVNDSVNKEKAKKNVGRQFQKSKRKSEVTVRRRSLRVLNQDPANSQLPAVEPKSVTSEVQISSEEFVLTAVGFEKQDLDKDGIEEHEEVKKAFADYEVFIDSLKKTAPVVKTKSNSSLTLKDLHKDIRALEIEAANAQKVTVKRVYSMAVHPSSTDLLVAAGDIAGNLGLWKPLLKDPNNGTYLFKAAASAINTLKFCPLNSNKLYLSSFSGRLRCLDLGKAVFEEVIIDDIAPITSFDFTGSGHTIVAAHKYGDVNVYDARESKEKAVKTFVTPRSISKCLSCHPLKEQYFLSSHVDGSVLFFDMRSTYKRRGGKLDDVFCLNSHSKSVNGAYFSPVTGNSVLTTCLDNSLRVFDSTTIGKEDVKLRASCRHDNRTGRWLTPFKATWHPDSEEAFVVGSMQKPRQIDIYNSHAKMIHALRDSDVLTTTTSVHCFFKNSHLFGGNAAGKVYMFTNLK